ncbi:MAG TPA: sigma-70 family RNA polymerase sigma factor [Clostridia bacterium]|nr:sigma-70 family RNA polymerase sigma factor [Clostridia bacterium]
MELPERTERPGIEYTLTENELAALMDAYSNMLLRTAVLLLKDLRLAEDAVQETFLKFYAGYANYRGEAGIKTYLGRILVNECRQSRRRAWYRRNIPTPEFELELADESAETDIRSLHDRLSLTEALMKLNVGSREILLLHYYNGLTVREIADALGMPEGSVKSRLKRGRDRLRDILQEDFCDE